MKLLKAISEIVESINYELGYPTKKNIIKMLRHNLTSRVKYPIIGAYIVGSEARGNARPDSDLDIAIIIPKSDKITSLKRTENYHSKFYDDGQKPKWNGRVVDFQFFYEDDPELKNYNKILLF